MIQQGSGSIFDVRVDAYVNPVNCAGTMGRGLARQFALKYGREYVEDYQTQCRLRELRQGTIHVWRAHDAGAIVISAPTKIHWSEKSTVPLISATLDALLVFCVDVGVKSIAMPALGCGLGGLDFVKQVEPLICAVFATHPEIDVTLFPPQSRP